MSALKNRFFARSLKVGVLVMATFVVPIVRAGSLVPFVHTLGDVPRNIVVDSLDNVYTYSQSECVVYKFTPNNPAPGYWKKDVFAGTVTTPPALCPGFQSGTATAAKFGVITGLAIDQSDNLYIADSGVLDLAAGTVVAKPAIVKISPDAEVQQLIVIHNDRRVRPTANDLAVDSMGRIYLNNGGFISRIIPSETWPGYFDEEFFVGDKSVIGASTCTEFKPGNGANACFSHKTFGTSTWGIIQNMAFDKNDNLYVGVFSVGVIAKINAAAEMSLFAGVPYSLGSTDGGFNARFNQIAGLAYTKDQLVVADGGVPPSGMPTPLGGGTIREIDFVGRIVSTPVGTPLTFGDVDAFGSLARFKERVGGLALDSRGNRYITNSGWGTPTTIRVISPAGNVSTLLGIDY